MNALPLTLHIDTTVNNGEALSFRRIRYNLRTTSRVKIWTHSMESNLFLVLLFFIGYICVRKYQTIWHLSTTVYLKMHM